MNITRDQLREIMPLADDANLDLFLDPLNLAMREFEIDTPERQAAFLAQIAHESAELRYVREIASGGAYEGRADLGNTEPGDGRRFRGRGLIQVTGRKNYQDCGDALGVDLVADPVRLEQPDLACRSAAWFWKSRGLNAYADDGDFRKITRRINGGYNGLAERERYHVRAKAALRET